MRCIVTASLRELCNHPREVKGSYALNCLLIGLTSVAVPGSSRGTVCHRYVRNHSLNPKISAYVMHRARVGCLAEFVGKATENTEGLPQHECGEMATYEG